MNYGKKKILIVGVNSQFIHSLLSIHYIFANTRHENVSIFECNINMNLDSVACDILSTKADVVAFSTYIFNIDFVVSLSRILKSHGITIVFGGIEVENNIEKYRHCCNYILVGDGEVVFDEFLFGDYNEGTCENLFFSNSSAEFCDVDKILLNKRENVVQDDTTQTLPKKFLSEEMTENVGNCTCNKPCDVTKQNPDQTTSKSHETKSIEFATTIRASKSANLATIKSPYTEKYFELARGKIAYFEASRGCPFKCSYCMSANSTLSLSTLTRVFDDLSKFFGRDIKVLKFVDRTFNANREYSNAIIKFVIENQDKFSFRIHFEIAPELICDELVELLKSARPNFIRMEIGMQSLNRDTLKKINRPFDEQKLIVQIAKLTQLPNIDCHVDIIAGLPFENFESLTSSFDKLYQLQPTEIQLGMLKMLPNSPLYLENIDGYQTIDTPPYQITQSKWLTSVQVDEILRTEQVANRLYNSLRFRRTLQFSFSNFKTLNHNYASPFRFFHDFAMSINNLQSLSLFDLYGELLEFLSNCGLPRAILIDIMRFDVACFNNSRNLPRSLFVQYPKKQKIQFDKSKFYLLPLFHDIFGDYHDCELNLLFDYSDFDYLKREFKYAII